MMVTSDGELGFNSGEGALEADTTSKEGTRRENYPIRRQGHGSPTCTLPRPWLPAHVGLP